MPKLIRLYIIQVIIGFGLSAIFVALLLWLNVANLGHLIAGSDMGWLAVIMLVVFNGVVFAGVQFSLVIMGMADDNKPPKGRRLRRLIAAPIKSGAKVAGPPKSDR